MTILLDKPSSANGLPRESSPYARHFSHWHLIVTTFHWFAAALSSVDAIAILNSADYLFSGIRVFSDRGDAHALNLIN